MSESKGAPEETTQRTRPAPVGVVVVAHGCCASSFLDAARAMVGADRFVDVVAVDAGVGVTPELRQAICDAMNAMDRGRGVLLLTDVTGSSPSTCSRQVASTHHAQVVSGLSLPMLLKIAFADRRALTVEQLAACCVEAGKRAIGEI
jgi:PTS system mannose-specific IIA component